MIIDFTKNPWVVASDAYLQDGCRKLIIVKVLYNVPHKLHNDIYMCYVPLLDKFHKLSSWQFDPITYIRAPGKISNGV